MERRATPRAPRPSPVAPLAGLLALALALAPAPPARAAGRTVPPAAALRLSDLLRELRERSPAIAAARARAGAAAAVPARVRALDDPTLSWEAWDTPDVVRVDRAENNIFKLSQRLPFPGKRRLAGVIAEREADMARIDAVSAELDAETMLKEAFVDLWQAHENARVFAREKEIVERFARTAEQRYATGGIPQADVLRAQVELSHALNRIRTGDLAIAQARVRVNALLSRDPASPLGEPESLGHPRLGWTADELVDLALDERPELRARTAAVERERAGVALAEREFYPDFEVSVSRFVNLERPDGFGAMAGITLPFVQPGKRRAAVAEGNARLAAAQADRRALEDRIRGEVRRLFLAASTASLQHDVFLDTHIPQAEQALRVTEAAYAAGSVDLMAFLDAVRAIEEAHLEHIAAQAEFATTWADIERAVGRELSNSRGGAVRR